jgi:CSLREA domain-containing protein
VLLALVMALPGVALARPQPAPTLGILYTVNSLEDTPPALDGFICTLREAILAANGDATDCGAPGADADAIQFVVTGTITLTFELPTITDHLTIHGNDQITIDGADSYRMFTVNGTKTLTLNDLVLYHAFADSGEGGAVRNFGTLYVNRSTFLDNHANAGGGAIYSFGIADISSSEFISNTGSVGGAIMSPGILGLTDSVFRGNTADIQTRGGALWSSGPLLIFGGQFIGNRAGAGGAIYARQQVSTTTLLISGAVFDDNRGVANYPDGNGGALQVDNVPTTIQASTFTRNAAQSGGAIYVAAAGALTVTQSTLHDQSSGTTNGAGLYNLGSAYLSGVTFSANSASHGGGIDNLGVLTLTNVTLSQNQSTYGGGLKNEAYSAAWLTNVTLAGNSADSVGGGILNSGFDPRLYLTNVFLADSPDGDNCSFFPPPDVSQNNLSTDDSCGFGAGRDHAYLPLGPLANNGGPTQTHLPQTGSAAIEGGTATGAPGTDQRGTLRPQGTLFDVGAVEVMPGELMRYLHLPLILR